MVTMPVRVARTERAARDVCLFELTSLDGRPLPPFSAGAHIDVEAAAGVVRQYSLCNDAEERHRYQIAVLRGPRSRGGSAAMHERVREGDVIRIGRPRNHFPLVDRASQSLPFAGGIGFTSLLCMAERPARIGADFALHCCARSADRMAFRERIALSRYAERVSFHVDDGSPAQKLDLDKALASARPGAHLFVCGPGGFLEAVRHAARDADWTDARIHFEYFSALPLPKRRRATSMSNSRATGAWSGCGPTARSHRHSPRPA